MGGLSLNRILYPRLHNYTHLQAEDSLADNRATVCYLTEAEAAEFGFYSCCIGHLPSQAIEPFRSYTDPAIYIPRSDGRFPVERVYAPVVESTDELLRGLVKTLALTMSRNHDLDEISSGRSPLKFLSESATWRQQVAVPPDKADRSVPVFLACIMAEVSMNSVVSKELPHLLNKGEPWYRDEMRQAIGHLGVQLAGRSAQIKKILEGRDL